jgi:hypothetical protein
VRKRRFVACCALATAATLTAAQAAESPVTLDASPRVSGGIGLSGGEPSGACYIAGVGNVLRASG